NIRFGVREHAMGAISNGLAYTQEWIPYTATFLVFADYMRPTLRLAALSHLQTLFIFTHDSFWVGEDGPTHQPIEQIESLRLIPNLNVYRPADGLEVALCYASALKRQNGPSALLFTRQGLPTLNRSRGTTPQDLEHGAYAVIECGKPEIILVATGSEVATACEAAAILESKNKAVKVVSMPCVENYCCQDSAWKEALIPSGVPTAVVEAGTTGLWSSYLGRVVLELGKTSFGASAPGELLAKEFGFTAESIAERALASLEAS
ncbi:MAG: transketolase, partial [Bdellovibrionales bacterium]|nr:transketolase [Bdellovibrionales bacterium]